MTWQPPFTDEELGRIAEPGQRPMTRKMRYRIVETIKMLQRDLAAALQRERELAATLGKHEDDPS